MGRDALLAVSKEVLDASPGELTQVSIRGGVSRLTRFCDNYIHQNVAESGHTLSVKVIFGKKIGTASTNALDSSSVRIAVEKATAMAKLQKPNEEFMGIPGPQDIPEVDTLRESTFQFTPEDRARGVKVITDAASAKGFAAAGSYSTSASEVLLANSQGLLAFNQTTRAILRTVVMAGSGSGFGDAVSMDVRDISPEEVAATAVSRCEMAQNPVTVPAGEYEVILEPHAVADILGYLVRSCFSAQAVREGRSPLAGKSGEKVFGDSFTIWDDGLDTRGLPVPFDMEGIPKRKVMLAENGVVKDLLYDFKTAKKDGVSSTGHGGFGGFGAMAVNVFMAPGQDTVENMIKRTKKGILITRFHYTNMAHPMRVLVTGMTRDGTFLVEDGAIKGPVRNFRFTESAFRVFETMDMVSSSPVNVGRAVVPAIRVPAFNFTGVTEH